jgi:hypothetical protein
MKDASNVTLMAIVAALLFPVSDGALAAQDYDTDYYGECILKNVKPGMDRSAIQLIHQACEHKATPKKCHAVSGAPDLYDPFGPGTTVRSKCVDSCKNEGYYSRTFGDCSKG